MQRYFDKHVIELHWKAISTCLGTSKSTSTSTSYTLPSHLTTIARGGGGGGGCCMRKREYDRKDRSIVDRKPEENE